MSGAVNPPWVLKFISGKYQGGEFPLEEGREYVVGRSSECDMVLVEDMVSRAHASLSVVDDRVILRDNNSTNGSFVNGERVNECVLNEGDRILFGTSIIKLLRGSNAVGDFLGRNLEEARHSVPVESPTETGRQQRATRNTVAGMMSGLLEEVPLPDLLQLFATSRKTGVLRVQSQREARVFLREGRAVYCEFTDTPGLDPEKVAFRVMAWTSGMFVLEPWEEREFDREIGMSTEGMMMEAMRLLDELQNYRSDVPLDATLSIPSPLVLPLRELEPELLDTFQLVLNYGRVETILCATEAEDIATLRSVNELFKKGYVTT